MMLFCFPGQFVILAQLACFRELHNLREVHGCVAGCQFACLSTILYKHFVLEHDMVPAVPLSSCILEDVALQFLV